MRLIGAMRAFGMVASLAALAGCSEPPRDPGGTTERIRRSGTILLGEVEGAPRSREGEAALANVAARLDARVARVPGPGEELLDELEKGELDVVYGHFAMTSPWSRNVHFGSPLGGRETVGKGERVPRFAFRHGENGWIMRVEREVRR